MLSIPGNSLTLTFNSRRLYTTYVLMKNYGYYSMSRQNMVIWVVKFQREAKNLANFVYLSWKLDKPYCHMAETPVLYIKIETNADKSSSPFLECVIKESNVNFSSFSK